MIRISSTLAQSSTGKFSTSRRFLVVCLLLIVSGCASDYREPARRPYTHPLAGCNAYPPSQVGENSVHVARDYVDCPVPLPALTDTRGASRANKVLLTTDLINHMRLTPAQLSHLQFYNSHRIILQRELAGADQFVDRGRLVTRDGRYFDRVVVERGTPGVATHISGDAISVDFGQGTPMHFGLTPNRVIRNPLHKTYRLMGWDWEASNTAKVNFNNTVYRMVGPSHVAALLIDQDEMRKRTTQRQVLPGRTIDGREYDYRYQPYYRPYPPR